MEGSNTVIDNRPSVKVFYDCDHLSEADFVSVLLGIEEEGIPYDVQAEHCSSVLELAHNASLNSRLGVGVGISKEALFFSMRSWIKRPLFLRLSYIRQSCSGRLARMPQDW